MRRRGLSLVCVAIVAALLASCGASWSDVERHLDHRRYARALRTVRRIDDPGLRLASETRMAEWLLRRLDGDLRVSAEPAQSVAERLGVLPPVFASGGALPLALTVSLRRSGPVSMSFRILGLGFQGRRYLRAGRCPPDEAVGITCTEWLAGAPLEPTCVVRDPGRETRAAVGALRWMSGGLVNAEPPPSPQTVCERAPIVLEPAARAGLEVAGRRLEDALVHAPRRAGLHYQRSELLYVSTEPATQRDIRIQIAFHLDRRHAPLRRTAVLPLPDAASPAEALAGLFAEPLPLRRVFRIAEPPPR